MVNVNNVKIETKDCNLWIEKTARISLRVTRSITKEENEYMITSAIDHDNMLKAELHRLIYGEIQDKINRLHHEVMHRVNVQDGSIQMFDELFDDLTDLISYKKPKTADELYEQNIGRFDSVMLQKAIDKDHTPNQALIDLRDKHLKDK